MKCGVCGNELKPDSNRCSVCGTMYEKGGSLKAAMSNISSLANALKAKREVVNNNKAFEEDLKKVSTREQDIEDLYSKDIELVEEDTDYNDDFDLNAFYQESMQKKKTILEEDEESEPEYIESSVEEDDNEYIEEDESYSENEDDEPIRAERDDYIPLEDFHHDDDIEETQESIDNEINIDESENNSPILEEVKIDENPMIFDDSEKLHATIDSQIELAEAEEEAIKPTKEEVDNSAEISFDQDSVEDTSQEIKLDLSAISEESSKTNEGITSGGYIKENEIKTGDESVENEQTPQVASDSNDSGEIEIGVAFEQEDAILEQENMDPVKADDVPYTQLEEVNSDVSDNHPIVIADKDVVGASQPSGDNIPKSPSKDTKVKGGKPNKFCAVMARILLVLAVLAFAVVGVHKFIIKDMTEMNVVFEFIHNFLTAGDNLQYVVLGILGACVLAILFSLMQLIFVKKRKIGAITLLISFIIAGALAGGFYYFEYLMPAIEFGMQLVGM